MNRIDKIERTALIAAILLVLGMALAMSIVGGMWLREVR